MITVLLIGLGLVMGSFVNALVWRLHKGRDWVRERSECPHCHRTLAAKDLVPVVSWLMLGGKCRYCRKPIPDSPITELSVPTLFLLSYYMWLDFSGLGLALFVMWLLFLVAFVALAVYDFRWFLLPDKIVFPLMGLAAVYTVTAWTAEGRWQALLGAATGAAVISGLFYMLHAVSKGEWIGFGDVKLGIVLGLLAGGLLPALLLLFVASFLGTLITVPLVLAGKAHRKTHLPFGPLLIAGCIVTVLFGDRILDWLTASMLLA
ncbi:MAG TPA: prepilin peptidase [Candidatus Saccharimonadales bacterium]|nr:prepilin peptidase [Candidatus Saccharimonadales bacterium]